VPHPLFPHAAARHSDEMRSGRVELTVEYVLSRGDVVRGYLYSWRYSASSRWQMVLLALGLGLLAVGPRWLFTGALRASDLRAGLLWAIGLLVFIPFWSALRLKRETRILTLSERGLDTVIGDRTLHVPWSGLAAVIDANEFVIIAGRNMNAFYVPARAFADGRERARFVESANSNLAQHRRRAG
jgi:hypothetical protein